MVIKSLVLKTSIGTRARSHMFLFVRSNKMKPSNYRLNKKEFSGWSSTSLQEREERSQHLSVFFWTSLLNIILTFVHSVLLFTMEVEVFFACITLLFQTFISSFVHCFLTLSSLFSSFSFSVFQSCPHNADVLSQTSSSFSFSPTCCKQLASCHLP